MNYKSELNGWALEMAIRAKTAGITPEEAIADTKKLVDYAYTPRKDLEGTAKDLFELVRNAPPGLSSVDALIGTLEHIREDRIRQQIDPMPDVVLPGQAANGKAKGVH